MKGIKKILSVSKVLVTDPALLFSLLRNIFFFLANKKILVIALTEHIGDIVAAEPIARYLKEKKISAGITWVINKKYKELLLNSPSISRIRTVTSLTEWILLKRLFRRVELVDLHISGKVCEKHGWTLINLNSKNISIETYFLKGNLLYCFSRTAGLDVNDKTAPKFYLTATDSPTPTSRTVVLHTSSNIPEKNWPSSCWDQLVNDLIDIYNPRKIIEIGFTSRITIQHPLLERFVGRKSLILIGNLINDCSLYIGVESGFAHVANALEKQSIILAGKLPQFENYMPYSGKFMNEARDIVLFFDKTLAEMNYNEFRQRFIALLKNKV